MDNDKKIIKILKQHIKQIKFKFDYRDIKVMTEQEGNHAISEMLGSEVPAYVARGGATEMRCIAEYLRTGKFSEKIKSEISNLSGVFPNDADTLAKFCDMYINAISQADIVSLWGVGAESQVVHHKCLKSKFTELHALEPYYFCNPWSAALRGKKVLVIHPFKDSIEHQYYNNRALIYPDKDVLPQFAKLTCIKAVQSIAGQKTEFVSWFEALEYMKHEIDKSDFEVAIIGAGAYGLPLAAYCKEIGKQAIQMSGATQLLFGIKGKRWDNHPIISKFYNDVWIRPDSSETPTQKQKVEGGSYW